MQPSPVRLPGFPEIRRSNLPSSRGEGYKWGNGLAAFGKTLATHQFPGKNDHKCVKMLTCRSSRVWIPHGLTICLRIKFFQKGAGMTFIQTIPEEQAEGLLHDQYEAARKTKGYVPNYIKAFSLHPEVYDAWTKLQGAIRSTMRLRRYELVTFATAMALDCSY
jgi:hypothetical protein